jgi:hypothetical protein
MFTALILACMHVIFYMMEEAVVEEKGERVHEHVYSLYFYLVRVLGLVKVKVYQV